MLTYLTTSLFKSPAQTLVNTVNTVGVMGKGIAKTFKQLYPEMYQEYRQLCRAGKMDIGKLYIYRTPNKIIVNFPTKKHWRSRSRVEYIEAGLQEFVRIYDKYGISTVSFPQLGCGNGELNWEKQVQPVMERYLKNLPIAVYIHLYLQQTDFVPERLDAQYARQVQQERRVIPFSQVWQDLQALTTVQQQLDMFTPKVEMDGERILFQRQSSPSLTVYRQDVEDLWNTLRLNGTISINQVPEPIRADGATECIFDWLTKLSYVKPIELQPIRQHTPGKGLQYMPPPQINESQLVETVE
jgi:O-acetyl-ADP-ribose deacetylase (regulator of RNase III)